MGAHACSGQQAVCMIVHILYRPGTYWGNEYVCVEEQEAHECRSMQRAEVCSAHVSAGTLREENEAVGT